MGLDFFWICLVDGICSADSIQMSREESAILTKVFVNAKIIFIYAKKTLAVIWLL